MVRFSINAFGGLHGHVRIVGGPPEQKGAPVNGLNLLRHQRMPPDKVEHVVGQGGGRVNAPGSQVVGDALRTNKTRELEPGSRWMGWRACEDLLQGGGRERKESPRLESAFSTSQQ